MKILFRRPQSIKFLIVGGWNTIFGYANSVVLYWAWSEHLHLVSISFISNSINITMAFLCYKIFVFQTKGNWLREYVRSLISYAGTAMIGIALLWLLVDFSGIAFWLAQAVTTLIMICGLFFLHKNFTFAETRVNSKNIFDRTNTELTVANKE